MEIAVNCRPDGQNILLWRGKAASKGGLNRVVRRRDATAQARSLQPPKQRTHGEPAKPEGPCRSRMKPGIAIVAAGTRLTQHHHGTLIASSAYPRQCVAGMYEESAHPSCRAHKVPASLDRPESTAPRDRYYRSLPATGRVDPTFVRQPAQDCPFTGP